MPGRAWVAGGAAALVMVGGGLTYRHQHASGGCPRGMSAVGVTSVGPPAHWSACASHDRRALVVTNTGDETLLVSAPDGTSLGWRPPVGSSTAFLDLTEQTLASMTELTPDRQAGGGGRHLMLGPRQSVEATAPTGATTVTVSRDYYATARWALAQSIAGWAAGQAAAPAPGAVHDVLVRCAADLHLPASYLAEPPRLGDVANAAISRPACLTAVRTLAPVEAADEIVYEVTDMARQFERTLPTGVWRDIGRESAVSVRAP